MRRMAKTTPPKGGEEEARRLISSVLEVAVTPWDDGGGSGSRYDFNLGDHGAVEVTSLADEDMISVLHRGHRNTGTRPSSRLRKNWMVTVQLPTDMAAARESIDFRGLMDRIEEALVELERRGESEFNPHEHYDHLLFCADPACPYRGLVRERIGSATTLSVRPGDMPAIFASLAWGHVSHGPNDLPAAIEHCLEDKPDNWKKLQVPGKTERQIFFWAYSNAWGAHRALHYDELPDRAPDVEKYGITAVWAGVFGQWDWALFWSARTGWRRVREGGSAGPSPTSAR
jgi:hypothetical protein